MAAGRFATAISCMDGRVIVPTVDWMRAQFNVDYVDVITEAGPDLILARGDDRDIESIRKRIKVSIDAHGSEVVAIFAHYDCAGNPVSKDEHLAMLGECMQRLTDWRLKARVLGFWLDENWSAQVIFDQSA